VTGLVVLFGTVAVGLGQGPPSRLDRVLSFQDGTGRTVLSSDFPDKWLLVYFGYMHCSDLCPTGLSVLAQALQQIGPAAAELQPLFVTVDPERDRGEELRRFAAAFDPHLLGLGGSLGQIKEAAAALGVSFEKVGQADAGYVVDHSSLYVLIEPMHRQIFSFKIAEPHLLAAKLLEHLRASGTALDRLNNLGAYR
jgi:protein SCO1/2